MCSFNPPSPFLAEVPVLPKVFCQKIKRFFSGKIFTFTFLPFFFNFFSPTLGCYRSLISKGFCFHCLNFLVIKLDILVLLQRALLVLLFLPLYISILFIYVPNFDFTYFVTRSHASEWNLVKPQKFAVSIALKGTFLKHPFQAFHISKLSD